MPNRKQHAIAGLFLAVAFFFLLDWLKLSSATGGALMILIGAVLPDWIEPSYHYTHRSFWHSKKILKIVAWPIIPLFLLGFLTNFFFWISYLLLGYALHLVMDSTTKMGLPKK